MKVFGGGELFFGADVCAEGEGRVAVKVKVPSAGMWRGGVEVDLVVALLLVCGTCKH